MHYFVTLLNLPKGAGDLARGAAACLKFPRNTSNFDLHETFENQTY